MPRPPRAAPGGLIYHALNRANARMTIFESDEDCAEFERVLGAAVLRHEMRLLAYCILPTHFHLLLWPHAEGDLSRFMRWLTMTHTQRWHARHQSAGTGHLYQGRFKSFPVQSGDPFLAVCRYVERAAVLAHLVERAQDWRWCSLTSRQIKDASDRPPLSPWPVEGLRDWTTRVNRPFAKKEAEAVERSIARGQPFGAAEWQMETAARLGLESTFRPRGRPRKSEIGP